ncbi:MAG: cobalamin-dependent protein, partial [Candidatus Omnitrophota bacterium]
MKKIKKILFINPPLLIKRASLEILRSFPLGLASMAAVLKKEGFSVQIMDCFSEGFSNRKQIGEDLLRIGLSDEELTARVMQYDPDLAGVAIQFSCQLSSALQIGALVKSLLKDIVLVAGGNHVTAACQTIPGDIFDWIIMGEGEYRLPKLIQALNKGDDSESSGILRASGTADFCAQEYRADFIEDLDSLPLPQYDLLPLERYWQQTGGRRWINIMATRGCPYECVFCSVHSVMGKNIRYRSVEKVIEELRFLKQRFHIEDVYFEDDNLTFDMRWAKELFERIIKEKLD